MCNFPRLKMTMHFRDGSKVEKTYDSSRNFAASDTARHYLNEWKRDGFIPIGFSVEDGYMPYHTLNKVDYKYINLDKCTCCGK